MPVARAMVSSDIVSFAPVPREGRFTAMTPCARRVALSRGLGHRLSEGIARGRVLDRSSGCTGRGGGSERPGGHIRGHARNPEFTRARVAAWNLQESSDPARSGGAVPRGVRVVPREGRSIVASNRLSRRTRPH